MVRALVSAAEVSNITRTHADRLHDLGRRLGCTADEATQLAEESSAELVEALVRRPESVGDLVGGLFARGRLLAIRQRNGRHGPAPNEVDAASPGLAHASAQSDAVQAALDLLPDTQRCAALIRDSYGLTLPQASVALDLEPLETARSLALARLALIAQLDNSAPVSLAGHDVAVGDLGQLADGTAAAGGRFAALRRHVAGCAVCAGVLDAQTRGAAMLSALPVLQLSDNDRAPLLQRSAARAAELLPSAEQIRREIERGNERTPLLSPLLIGLAILLAVLLGGLLGAVLAGGVKASNGQRCIPLPAHPCSISATRNASSRA